ncbi:hypothetical protein GPALN_012792 [Globodera pallida]|nr:hypothetical protein GPALN_012792 [Globodera pallida]
MSFRSHRRRSSGTGGNLLSRRSSMSLRDFEQLVKVRVDADPRKKRQRLSDWVLFPVMLGVPPFIVLFHSQITFTYHQQALFEHILDQICSSVPPIVLLLTIQLQLFFLWYLPARDVQVTVEEGEPFATRFTGFESSLLVCLLYILGALLGLYPGHLIFTHWVGLLFWLSLLSIFTAFLLLFTPRSPPPVSPPSPSTDDSSISVSAPLSSADPLLASRTPSLVSQFFYGFHLQPVLLNVDVKSFLTIRLALTFWALFLISAQFVHRRLSDANFSPFSPLITTTALQLLYIVRRQWAGFYRIFSVLVLLPTVYLVPVTLGAISVDVPQRPTLICAGLFLFGLLCQYLNTATDLQRHNFRRSNGDLKIDGKDPFYICVRFRKKSGESATALLLGSGYWAMARHPNYTAEWFSFLAWTLAWTQPLAFVPLAFLTAILWVRTKRDELRCLALYGHFWTQHCARVPYLFFPGF